MVDVTAADTIQVRRDWRALPWHVVVPVVLSLSLGLWGIDSLGLWDDEQQTALAIPQLLWRTWEAPLLPYYAAMWVWTLGGHLMSDLWLRLPSVIAMAGAVAFTSSASQRVGSRRAAMLAGSSLALMPSIARYAQEVRVYAFATLLAAGATWALVNGATDRRVRWWVLYAALLTGIGVMAPFAFAIVPAHAVVMASHPRWRRSVRPWLLACAATVPVLLVGAYLAYRFGSMHAWLDKPSVWAYFTDVPGIALTPAYGAALLALGVMTRRGLIWLASLLIGMGALWIVSQGPAVFWLQRSFLPLAPLLAIAAGFAAARLSRIQFLALAALLAILAAPSLIDERQPGARGLDAPTFAAIIDREGEVGDTINTAVNSWLSWGVQRYSMRADSYRYAPSSSGRAWVLDSGVSCERLAQFDVPPRGTLVLCASLPADWEKSSASD